MGKLNYNVHELAELLDVSESKAYQYIQVLNSELASKGYLTVRGRIPAAYVQQRFFGVLSAGLYSDVSG